MTAPDRPLRLGFPVKVMGKPGLKSQDTRRWQKNPHLKCSLELLDAVLDYLRDEKLDMYRMSSDIAPYATHPDMPQFHAMVAESDAELRAFGAKAREYDIRLSFHPSQYVLLNSARRGADARRASGTSPARPKCSTAWSSNDEAVMVTHVGGVYDDHARRAARAGSKGGSKCPEHVRRRLVLENDDIRFSMPRTCLWIHEADRRAADLRLSAFLVPQPSRGSTCGRRWSGSSRLGQRACGPRSTSPRPRTELREVKQKITPKQREAAKAGKSKQGRDAEGAGQGRPRASSTVLRPPVWTGHADFTNPFEFATFMRMAEGLVFDVMMEGKSKDLSLLRLRPDLLRFAPDVAARFGITAQDAAALAADEAGLERGVAAEEEPDVDEGQLAAAE